MSNILPSLILTPLIGGLLLVLMGNRSESGLKNAGIVIGSLTFFISLLLAYWVTSQPAVNTTGSVVPSVQFQTEWLSIAQPFSTSADARWMFVLGCDGVGNLMVLLTTIVTLCALTMSTLSVPKNRVSYAGWLLLAEAGLLTVFLAMDVLTFYIGFELTLIPLLLLIAGWGSSDSLMAGRRFVLFTLAGSIPMIVAITGLVSLYANGNEPTISISELSQRAIESAKLNRIGDQAWIFWLFVVGFGIKTAILPLHSWLPTTYYASHPTTTALMAAVVLKLGLFGFIRLVIPLLPHASAYFGPYVFGTLGVVAILYGAMNALAQTDLRLLLAYSSLSHVGFITLGMFALNEEGLGGAALQMFNHGITTAAMFLLIDSLILRRGTHCLTSESRGLGSLYPRLATFFFFFIAAGAGVPGLNNFVGEVLALSGMAQRNLWLAGAGTVGIVLGAWYGFRLFQNMFMGPPQQTKSNADTMSCDIRGRELAMFVGLAVVCLFIGVFPQRIIQTIRLDMERLDNVCSTAFHANSVAVASPPPSVLNSIGEDH